jgi:hypothetical protein
MSANVTQHAITNEVRVRIGVVTTGLQYCDLLTQYTPKFSVVMDVSGVKIIPDTAFK